MKIKVINAGNCMLCGKEIKIVTKQGNNKFPNIFFCPRCEKRRQKKDDLQAESESKRWQEIAKSYVQGVRAGLAGLAEEEIKDKAESEETE